MQLKQKGTWKRGKSLNKSYMIYSKISVKFRCSTSKRTSFSSNIFWCGKQKKLDLHSTVK